MAQKNSFPSTHLNTKELAARWKMHPTTLASWRMLERGPKFLKLGSKTLYPIVEVEAFEKRQLKGGKRK